MYYQFINFRFIKSAMKVDYFYTQHNNDLRDNTDTKYSQCNRNENNVVENVSRLNDANVIVLGTHHIYDGTDTNGDEVGKPETHVISNKTYPNDI